MDYILYVCVRWILDRKNPLPTWVRDPSTGLALTHANGKRVLVYKKQALLTVENNLLMITSPLHWGEDAPFVVSFLNKFFSMATTEHVMLSNIEIILNKQGCYLQLLTAHAAAPLSFPAAAIAVCRRVGKQWSLAYCQHNKVYSYAC